MDAVRVLIHALGFLIGAQVLDLVATHTGNQGLTVLCHFMHWGAYLPFAISASSALHEHRAMIIAVVAIVLLVGLPGTLPELADQVAPIGVGILVGTMLQHVVRSEGGKRHESTTALGPGVRRGEPRNDERPYPRPFLRGVRGVQREAGRDHPQPDDRRAIVYLDGEPGAHD